MKLVVTHPFADYAIGQEITDPETVKTVLAEHPDKVVKVAVHPVPEE